MVKISSYKTHIVLFICLLLFLSLSLSQASARVQIKSTCYNSGATVTESLMTVNADYTGVTILTPSTITSNGEGKSINDDFSEFSDVIVAETIDELEKIEAEFTIESGDYEWESEVTASEGESSLGMSVEYAVEEGNLEASYGNAFATHTEGIITKGAQYSGVSIITDDGIASTGKGDNANFNSNSTSIYHKVHVDGGIKWAEINTYLSTNSSEIDYTWKQEAKTFIHNSSLGMRLEGVSRNGTNLWAASGMEGRALKFPTQYLPPGKVVIKEIIPVYEDLKQSVEAFRDDFDTDPVGAFYSVDQGAHISPNNESEPQSWDSELEDEEHFNLGMAFNFNHP